MLKFASAIVVACLLLLAELLTVSPKAVALSGFLGVQPGSIHSLMQKAGCDQADEDCEKGKEMVCTPGGPDPQCACDNCQVGVNVRCPKFPACFCDPGTVCPGLSGGGWCRCPN
jgi:hypothetical protein